MSHPLHDALREAGLIGGRELSSTSVTIILALVMVLCAWWVAGAIESAAVDVAAACHATIKETNR